MTTFPDEPGLVPFDVVPPGGRGNLSGLSTVQPELLVEARAIALPEDRSLALQRIANAAIFSNQLGVAHAALGDAAAAALQVKVPLVHDQRLTAIITSLLNLAEAHIREGKEDVPLPDSAEAPAALPQSDRDRLIRRAQLEWHRAYYLAARIISFTYRSELLYRVVDNEAFGSQTIANEYPQAKGQSDSTRTVADQMLLDAAVEARLIDRPVWRDRALVTIATSAAGSKQFARGLEIALTIPQPEVRTDALVKIAEGQARRGDPAGATVTYREAVRAVESIPLADPRSVLIGVLIDNLISVGRFEDARATVALYPDQSRRYVALGAIAESQGRRGASESARGWIARDIPEGMRPALYRRVNAGILTAIEQNRSRDLTNQGR